MSDAEEVKVLRDRVAELEQQLEEEREEMEWDLKAARESSAATVRKLEQELEQLKKSSPATGEKSSGDADAALQRALMAERKVAELQLELKRVRESAPKMTAPNEDQVMRQRAESAEKERDDLRRQNRTLERTLAEKERALSRAEGKAENTAELKRQIEEVRRDLLAKERELSKLRLKSDEDKQSDEDLEQLRKQLSDALAQLDEKNENLGFSQARVRELADEVAYLKEQNAAAEKEKEELKAAKAKLDQKINTHEQKSSRQAELEEKIESLQHELARLKMASSQMLEQRERETERLKTDLSDVRESKTINSKKVSELEAKQKNLEQELALVRSERDEAVSALRRYRERESTVVSRPGAASANQQAEPDPFEEKTKRVPLGDLRGADRSLDSTQPNLPSGGGEEASPPVVPGELIAEDADGVEFPQVSDPDEEVPVSDQAAGLRGGEKFASKSTNPGEPPPVVPQEGTDVKGGKSEKVEDGTTEKSDDAEAGTSSESVLDEEITAPLNSGNVDAKEPVDDELHDEKPESDDIMAEWIGEEEGDSAPAPAGQENAQVPKSSASPKGMGVALKWGLISIGGLAGVGLIIAGALYFFPRWFGTQGVDLADSTQQHDDTSVVSEEAVESVDAGTVAVASGGDASQLDGQNAAESSGDQAQAGKEPDDNGQDTDHGGEQKPPKKLTPKQKAALRAAQVHGLKLLKKRKYKSALRFIEPWVSRMPDDPVLRYLYGRSLFYRKKLDDARIQMEKAVELKSDYADAWYELIGIYTKLKKKDKTRDAMEWFLSVVPKNDRRAKGVAASMKRLNRTH